ncbi:hypothetical protein Pla108_15380 [Botrimarina colliarenosi]|uniref:Transposase IS200-like domain-containing protein n=1 Tax=Botrimarina colliarenosi TaxID=2528001 RepID=A0A5C6AN99_9BACT|nr:transposase [Botrimarina colliarenosi]TWU00586.1 hypothetical protein Pla108_15380 [Botrimarina colliarenosi]
MKLHDEPIAFFITWSVYGTFLQGDSRWWRQRTLGDRPPQPRLENWHRDRLRHDVVLLNSAQRETVEIAIARHADHRGWRLWAANARSNHVHVVVTAPGFNGKRVRDQLKANCTRELRQRFDAFVDRPVWTVGGDWQCVNDEDDLHQVVTYAGESQERKGCE